MDKKVHNSPVGLYQLATVVFSYEPVEYWQSLRVWYFASVRTGLKLVREMTGIAKWLNISYYTEECPPKTLSEQVKHREKIFH